MRQADYRTCHTCANSQHLDNFRRSGRGYKKTCMACEDGRADSEGVTVAELRPAFQIRSGFGLSAAVDEDGDLVLTQETTVGTARIYLTEFEVHRLMSELQTRLGDNSQETHQ